MIRTLLVDDHPALRAGLQTVLRAEPGLVPLAAASSMREAEAEAARERPDVAVVDYHLQDGDGLTLCRRLKSAAEPPRLLIYSAYADARLTIPALVAGADGIVNKAAPADELFEAIRLVAKGEALLPPVSRELLERSSAAIDEDDFPILGMLIDRTPAIEVGQVLGLSGDEIDERIGRILGRLRPEVAAGGL